MFQTLIVVDQENLVLADTLPSVISFEEYLHQYPKLNESRTRIINLCHSNKYLSKGYYCSLLAEARNHNVLPSVKTINALRNEEGNNLVWTDSLIEVFKDKNNAGSHLIYFGKTEEPSLEKIASKLFQQYPMPILSLEIKRDSGSPRVSIVAKTLDELSDKQKANFVEQAKNYTQATWIKSKSQKRYRWDMAILIDPNEKTPPSDKGAISRFVKAAAKLGIHAQAVTHEQLTNLSQYDALFIRETTAIDHHTYRLARKAESLGMVVMDDPDSILRCCNKIFLHDAFDYQKVPSLKTEIVSDNTNATLDQLEQQFTYPMVLKMPESSFSKGVFKVESRQALTDKLAYLFEHSSLVLVQEYLYTDFDWRVGVLNGRAIYACRYMMARNHWQIYNHDSKRFFSGDFDTMPTFETPRNVLSAALKAAKVIGNGLYGVDIKSKGDKAYVIEVNDNPSIDHQVEDLHLGDELYMLIMSEFLRRLELRGR